MPSPELASLPPIAVAQSVQHQIALGLLLVCLTLWP